MNRATLLTSIAIVGLMMAFNTPVKAANSLLSQASDGRSANMPNPSYLDNPTTGGGYNGNWLCLNNPNSPCNR